MVMWDINNNERVIYKEQKTSNTVKTLGKVLFIIWIVLCLRLILKKLSQGSVSIEQVFGPMIMMVVGYGALKGFDFLSRKLFKSGEYASVLFGGFLLFLLVILFVLDKYGYIK